MTHPLVKSGLATSPTLAAAIAITAILANVLIADYNRQTAKADADQAWKTAVEQRLTRLETKMDRLLNVTQAALDAGHRLPKTP